MATRPIVNKYPLDPTGTNANNLVVREPHTLTGSGRRAIVPNYGAFFAESLVVRDTVSGHELVNGEQFVPVQLYQDATEFTGKEIMTVVIVTDETVNDEIEITYQAIGGEYGHNVASLREMIDNLNLDERPVEYGAIIGKPTRFNPAPHFHNLGEIYGFEYFVDAMNRIRQAIIVGSEGPIAEARQYIELVHQEVQENYLHRINGGDVLASVNFLNGQGNTAPKNGYQIGFGYEGNKTFQHFISTTHNSSNERNGFVFYASDGTKLNSLTDGSVELLNLRTGGEFQYMGQDVWHAGNSNKPDVPWVVRHLEFDNQEFNSIPQEPHGAALGYDASSGLALVYGTGGGAADGQGIATIFDSRNTLTGPNIEITGGRATDSRPKISIVQGSDSGLDADTVDGWHRDALRQSIRQEYLGGVEIVTDEGHLPLSPGFYGWTHRRPSKGLPPAGDSKYFSLIALSAAHGGEGYIALDHGAADGSYTGGLWTIVRDYTNDTKNWAMYWHTENDDPLVHTAGDTMEGGLRWDNVVEDPLDLSQHLALFKSGYGFSVSTDSLNIVADHGDRNINLFGSDTNVKGNLGVDGRVVITPPEGTTGAGRLDIFSRTNDEIATLNIQGTGSSDGGARVVLATGSSWGGGIEAIANSNNVDNTSGADNYDIAFFGYNGRFYRIGWTAKYSMNPDNPWIFKNGPLVGENGDHQIFHQGNLVAGSGLTLTETDEEGVYSFRLSDAYNAEFDYRFDELVNRWAVSDDTVDTDHRWMKVATIHVGDAPISRGLWELHVGVGDTTQHAHVLKIEIADRGVGTDTVAFDFNEAKEGSRRLQKVAVVPIEATETETRKIAVYVLNHNDYKTVHAAMVVGEHFTRHSNERSREFPEGGVEVPIQTVWHSGIMGHESGMDADTVDGLHPDGNQGESEDFLLKNGSFGLGNSGQFLARELGTDDGWPDDMTSVVETKFDLTHGFRIGAHGLNQDRLYFQSLRDTWGDIKDIWHSGYQGHNTGMDADLVDGSHKQTSVTDTTSDSLMVVGAFGLGKGVFTNNTLGDTKTPGVWYTNDRSDVPTGFTNGLLWVGWHPTSGNYGSQIYVDYKGKMSFRGFDDGAWTEWNIPWHQNNQGPDSGLDADLLDGEHGAHYDEWRRALRPDSNTAVLPDDCYIEVSDSNPNGFDSVFTFFGDGNQNALLRFAGGEVDKDLAVGGQLTANSATLAGPLQMNVAGDVGLFVNGENSDTVVWKVDATDDPAVNSTGFFLTYLGTGANNNNGLRLESSSSQIYTILQDGIVDFAKNPTVLDKGRVLTIADAGTGNGLDADLLDGEHGAFYRNADNLNAGKVPRERLKGTYDVEVTGRSRSIRPYLVGREEWDMMEQPAPGDINFELSAHWGKRGLFDHPPSTNTDEIALISLSGYYGNGSGTGSDAAQLAIGSQLAYRDANGSTWNQWNKVFHDNNLVAGFGLTRVDSGINDPHEFRISEEYDQGIKNRFDRLTRHWRLGYSSSSTSGMWAKIATVYLNQSRQSYEIRVAGSWTGYDNVVQITIAGVRGNEGGSVIHAYDKNTSGNRQFSKVAYSYVLGGEGEDDQMTVYIKISSKYKDLDAAMVVGEKFDRHSEEMVSDLPEGATEVDIETIWSSTNMGPDSGLDADTVDGFESQQILDWQTIIRNGSGEKAFDFKSNAYITVDGSVSSNLEGWDYGSEFVFYGQGRAGGGGSQNNWGAKVEAAVFHGTSAVVANQLIADNGLVKNDLTIGNNLALNGVLASNLTIDNGTNTNVLIKSNDSGESVLSLHGNTQGTGRLFVGQSSDLGGGIDYSGDGNPQRIADGNDYLSLYRFNGGTFNWTARNRYTNNWWEFRERIRILDDGEVLTTSDEGHDNGLHADLLDGEHGSHYDEWRNALRSGDDNGVLPDDCYIEVSDANPNGFDSVFTFFGDGNQNALLRFGGGEVNKDLTVGRKLTSKGIELGSDSVSSQTDVSRHLALYETTYGLGITSNTLNIVARNGSGAVSIQASGFDVKGDKVWHAGNSNLKTVDWTVRRLLFANGDSLTFDEQSNAYRFSSDGTTSLYLDNNQVWHGGNSNNWDVDWAVRRLIFGNDDFLEYDDSSNTFNFTGDGTTSLAVQNNKVWHEGNMGHESGLNADLVDGWHQRELRRSISSKPIESVATGNLADEEPGWFDWGAEIPNDMNVPGGRESVWYGAGYMTMRSDGYRRVLAMGGRDEDNNRIFVGTLSGNRDFTQRDAPVWHEVLTSRVEHRFYDASRMDTGTLPDDRLSGNYTDLNIQTQYCNWNGNFRTSKGVVGVGEMGGVEGGHIGCFGDDGTERGNDIWVVGGKTDNKTGNIVFGSEGSGFTIDVAGIVDNNDRKLKWDYDIEVKGNTVWHEGNSNSRNVDWAVKRLIMGNNDWLEYDDATNKFNFTGDGTTSLTIQGNTVWHEGNMGQSSGLDADLVDGWQAGQLRQSINQVELGSDQRFVDQSPGWYSWGATSPDDFFNATVSTYSAALITKRIDGRRRVIVFSNASNNLYGGYETAEGEIVWNSYYHTGNTTTDSNGNLRPASPIVRVTSDSETGFTEDFTGAGSGVANAEAKGATIERIEEGVYVIKGSLGFADEGWNIVTPQDDNSQELLYVQRTVDDDNVITLRTYHRTHPDSPSFAQNNVAGYNNGDPIDIPTGRWIDLRLKMAEKSEEDE